MCMQLPTHYEISWQDLAEAKVIPQFSAGSAGLSLSLPYTRETATALFALARSFKTALDEVELAREEIVNGTRGFKKGQA